MRALLAEDDRMIGESVANALKDASYAVDWVRDGDAASTALDCQDYDIVLLDLGLPKKDGLAVLRTARSSGNVAPVLVITARDAVEDRILGLDHGADDYVVKPFDMGELLARMRAVIRRKGGASAPILSNGRLSLDPISREATCGGGVARLTMREFALLRALMVRPGAILSRGELEDRIYGWGDEVESTAVEFLIHSLRRKLGAGSIKNVRRGRMDGPEGGVTRSLQFRLYLWLSLTIIVVAVAAGFLSYSSAFNEAIELQDDQLRQTAAFLQRQRLSAPPAEVAGPPDADPESRLIVLVSRPQEAWKPEGAAPGLRSDLPDGLQTIAIGGAPWRLFVSADDRGFRVAVGQQTAVRDEIANMSALRTVAPLLSLVVILPLLAGYLIRRTLQPLKSMAANLEFSSEPVWREIADNGIPSEIRPFVAAIKRLLARVAQSVAAQRRFLADAAHELRSPLTALSLQAERLEAAETPEEARARLAVLRRGIGRTRRLLDQLLALARAQGEPSEARPVRLTCVLRQVLEDLMPLAEAKRMDVGVVRQDDVVVRASEIDLTILLRNLVDNAIRYTPKSGKIDGAIEMGADGAVLRVDDTGPGIPPEERERVFDPFHRLLDNDEFGSGLGLSIVKTIADRLGASVFLGQSGDGGLQVTVKIPRRLIVAAPCDEKIV